MIKKIADTEVTINSLIAKRWSPRAFNSNFFLSNNDIKSLFEASRWAPSCYGDQPWRFIYFHKSDATEWSRALNCLSIGNQNWAMDASLLIVVCSNQLFNHNGQPNKWGQYDTGAAAENICLQATSLGLAAHQMGGFDEFKIRTLSNIPDQYDVMSFIAIGKILDESKYNVEQDKKEKSPRKRNALKDIYFMNKWEVKD